MLTPDDISRFYNNVLHDEESYHEVSEIDMKIAIRNMAEAYKPYNTNWHRQEGGIVANYNDPAHRCAYLHKYAPLHTCLVQDMFHKALEESYALREVLKSKFNSFNICSLGGGPGTDIIGIISACQEFGLITCSADVVDLMYGWKSTFNSIVEELRLGCYGSLSRNLNGDYFNYSYISSNLLQAIDREVRDSIRSADLITMVKFISAATCRDTEGMVKKIFNNMKPGAVVLFIDNAAGGFSEMIARTAQECELDILFGPLNHFLYNKPAFNVLRYGYMSCFETKVTIHILMKSSQLTYFQCQNLNNPSQQLIPKVSNNENREATSINMTLFSEVPEPPVQLTKHLNTLSLRDNKIHAALICLIILLIISLVLIFVYFYTTFFR